MTPPNISKQIGMRCRKLGTEVMCDDSGSNAQSAAAQIGLGIGDTLWGIIQTPNHLLKRITGIDSYLGQDRAWSLSNLFRAYSWSLRGNPLFIFGDTANHIFYGGLNTLTAGYTHIIFNQWLGLNIQYFTPPPTTIRESARVVSGGILVAMPLKGVVLNKMGIKAPPILEVVSETTHGANTSSASTSVTKASTAHLNFSKVARMDRIQPKKPSDIYDGYQNIPPGIWNSHPQLRVGPGDVPPLPRTVETSLGKIEIPEGSMVMGEGSTGNVGGSGPSGASGALGVSNSGSGGTTFVLAPTEVKTTATNGTSVASEVAVKNSPSSLSSLKLELVPGNPSQLPMTLPSAFQGEMVEKTSSNEFIVTPGVQTQWPMMDPKTSDENQGPIGDSLLTDLYYSMAGGPSSHINYKIKTHGKIALAPKDFFERLDQLISSRTIVSFGEEHNLNNDQSFSAILEFEEVILALYRDLRDYPNKTFAEVFGHYEKSSYWKDKWEPLILFLKDFFRTPWERPARRIITYNGAVHSMTQPIDGVFEMPFGRVIDLAQLSFAKDYQDIFGEDYLTIDLVHATHGIKREEANSMHYGYFKTLAEPGKIVEISHSNGQFAFVISP